ncbi:hypothetical protein [Vibrio anguillarum]|uniref:hypothetical protein n=1 Tax=Vibrio anguillarum TaxID=55601 RepID=UPI0003748B8F|nr:hypothetical protein [Vibrio anguillarum]MBT2921638.1 hypothetical protein [Vibrio anguillarum]RMZ65760.1 hypothetical protein D9U34_01505 [Vibrio anguillarum]
MKGLTLVATLIVSFNVTATERNEEVTKQCSDFAVKVGNHLKYNLYQVKDAVLFSDGNHGCTVIYTNGKTLDIQHNKSKKKLSWKHI